MKWRIFLLAFFGLLSVPAVADSIVGTVRTIDFATNNGDIRLRIKKSGTPTDVLTIKGSNAFVGVGTTSPVARLNVDTAASADASGLNTGLFVSNSTRNAGLKYYPSLTGTSDSAIQSTDYLNSVNTEGGSFDNNFNLHLNPFGGRVSINGGLTAPAQALDVRSSGTNVASFLTAGNSDASEFVGLGSGRAGDLIARLQFSSALTQLDFGTSPANSFASVTPLMTLLTTGNLGVGITSPASRLQSVSSAAEQATFSGWDSIGGAAAGNGEVHIGATAASQARLHFDVASASNMYIDSTTNSATSMLHLRTRTAGTAVEGIAIRGDGNVAIGTTSAVHKFVVRTASADNNVAIDDTGAGPTVDFRNDANSAYRPGSLHGSTLNIIGTTGVNVGSDTPVHKFSVHTGTNANLAVDDSAGTTVDFRNDANSAYVAGTIHGLTLSLTAASGVSITGGGGNVPHACGTRTNAGVSVLTEQACAAGEMVVGGGCSVASGGDKILQNLPCGNFNTADYTCSSTPAGVASTVWRCNSSTSTVSAYAICCTY